MLDELFSDFCFVLVALSDHLFETAIKHRERLILVSLRKIQASEQNFHPFYLHLRTDIVKNSELNGH